MVEDGRGGKRARGTESEITQVEMGGGGARVILGSGESSKTKQGVDRVVQIYDNGVESGDLTVPLLPTDDTFTGSPSFTGSPRTISYLRLSCRTS
jgi:hypothetical protein